MQSSEVGGKAQKRFTMFLSVKAMIPAEKTLLIRLCMKNRFPTDEREAWHFRQDEVLRAERLERMYDQERPPQNDQKATTADQPSSPPGGRIVIVIKRLAMDPVGSVDSALQHHRLYPAGGDGHSFVNPQ